MTLRDFVSMFDSDSNAYAYIRCNDGRRDMWYDFEDGCIYRDGCACQTFNHVLDYQVVNIHFCDCGYDGDELDIDVIG